MCLIHAAFLSLDLKKTFVQVASMIQGVVISLIQKVERGKSQISGEVK